MSRTRKERFFRAFCHDCDRFLLQSFSEPDVDQIAQSHGDICNHEVSVDETGPRHQPEQP